MPTIKLLDGTIVTLVDGASVPLEVAGKAARDLFDTLGAAHAWLYYAAVAPIIANSPELFAQYQAAESSQE